MLYLGRHPLQEARKVSASYLEPGEIFHDDDYYRVIRTHRKQDCIEVTCADRKGKVHTISYDLVGYDKFPVLSEEDFCWTCSATLVGPNDRVMYEHSTIVGFDKQEAQDKFETHLRKFYPRKEKWKIRDLKMTDRVQLKR